MRMLRWTCTVSLKDKVPSIDQRGRMGIELVTEVVNRGIS